MNSYKNLLRVIVYSSLAIFTVLQAREFYYLKSGTNGFDLSNPLVPADQIVSGGPPKDGIPAIDEPGFLKPFESKHIDANTRVLGLNYNGIAKAYPISILNWHEIVNDEFKGQPISITYCPLCGTGMAFDASNTQGFGVSGLLYNSDMLLYDRKTESLWSQIMAKAISGELKGQHLNSLPLTQTTWSTWLTQHPDSLILSSETGYERDYDQSPYIGYPTSEVQYFPTEHSDNRFKKKESVIGLVINKKQKVWPLSELNKAHLPYQDSLDGKSILVNYDSKSDMAWIVDEENKLLPAIRGFWFAWIAFYPDTEVFLSPDANN